MSRWACSPQAKLRQTVPVLATYRPAAVTGWGHSTSASSPSTPPQPASIARNTMLIPFCAAQSRRRGGSAAVTAYEVAFLVGSRPAMTFDRGDPHPVRWPPSSERARTVERVIDWTMGGKPEREGRRCENPECRQVLMITDPEWKLCGRCQYEARTRTSTAPASVTVG